MKTSTEVCRQFGVSLRSLLYAQKTGLITAEGEQCASFARKLFTDAEVERYAEHLRQKKERSEMFRKKRDLLEEKRKTKASHTVAALRLARVNAAERVLIEKLNRERESVKAKRQAWAKAREKAMAEEGMI